MYYATNYEGMEDGSVYPEFLDYIFDIQKIKSIRIWDHDSGKYMKIYFFKENNDDPDELLFKFHGSEAGVMAEEVRKRLYLAKEQSWIEKTEE